jgi:hypothetical protein
VDDFTLAVLVEDIRSDPFFFMDCSIKMISRDEIMRALMESMLEAVEASSFTEEAAAGLWSGTVSALSSCMDPLWIDVIHSILNLFFDNSYIAGARQLLHQLREVGLLEYDTPQRRTSIATPLELRFERMCYSEKQDLFSIRSDGPYGDGDADREDEDENPSRYMFVEEDPWYLKGGNIIEEVMHEYLYCTTLTCFLMRSITIIELECNSRI